MSFKDNVEMILIQNVNNFTRILQSLSDNFGTDIPDERIRVCLEIAGSVDDFEHALRFLESKNLIDVVVVFSLRTGEVLSYPVLKEKTQRMIKLYGVEEILLERKPVKW